MPKSAYQDHFDIASQFMPGGVNSSTRVSTALGTPFYVSRTKGSRVWDITGREFIDMCCSHGASLLGHGHPDIDSAVQEAMALGYASSFETEHHVELARRFCDAIPCAQKVRFCSAGSEATLHLIRACRGYTSRNKIMRFEGHFHGYHELIYMGGHPPQSETARNRERPYIESAGIPDAFAEMIVPIPFNDEGALRAAIERHGHETAVLVLEPVNYNCGGIVPTEGFLPLVRRLTEEAGILLFFDEIQSAFKKSAGGAQAFFGVVPDVCTVGKALGGGFPLSAFCGRSEVMDMFKPIGPVQHSGTFNAHPIPVMAGLAFLENITRPGFYSHLQKLEKRFNDGINRIIADYDLNMVVPGHGARFNIMLGRRTPALRYEDTFCHDSQLMCRIFRECWQRGVFFHDYGGGPLHHGYSAQHTIDDIDIVLNVIEDVFHLVRGDL